MNLQEAQRLQALVTMLEANEKDLDERQRRALDG